MMKAVLKLAAGLLPALAMASGAYAQSHAYPWSQADHPVLLECLKNPGRTTPPCDFGEWLWKDEGLWNSRITFLYQNQHFIVLERVLVQATAASHRYDDGDRPGYTLYWAFRQMLGGLHSDHERRLERWQQAVPDSVFVDAAIARLAYNRAWRIRGEGYASTVSPESWKLFHSEVERGIKQLQAAPQGARDHPVWHLLLLAMTLDTPERANVDAIFAEGARRWPDHYSLYHEMVARATPRWGGSWRAVDAFVSAAAKRLAASEGTSLYARLYASLHRMESPAETLMDWKRMRESFEDLIKRYPSAKFANRYASHACFARDKAAFAGVMGRLPPGLLQPDQWLTGHSHEACKHWASSS